MLILVVSTSLARVGTVWRQGHNRNHSRLQPAVGSPERKRQGPLLAVTGRQNSLAWKGRVGRGALSQGQERTGKEVVQFGEGTEQQTGHDGLVLMYTIASAFFTFQLVVWLLIYSNTP